MRAYWENKYKFVREHVCVLIDFWPSRQLCRSAALRWKFSGWNLRLTAFPPDEQTTQQKKTKNTSGCAVVCFFHAINLQTKKTNQRERQFVMTTMEQEMELVNRGGSLTSQYVSTLFSYDIQKDFSVFSPRQINFSLDFVYWLPSAASFLSSLQPNRRTRLRVWTARVTFRLWFRHPGNWPLTFSESTTVFFISSPNDVHCANCGAGILALNVSSHYVRINTKKAMRSLSEIE